jgi:hypothetical protein
MSDPKAGAVPEAAGEVRLRKPEQGQMEWVPQCTDDFVAATHGVRTVAAVVAKLDLSAFHEPIKAREGVAGRDATDPELLVSKQLLQYTSAASGGLLPGGQAAAQDLDGALDNIFNHPNLPPFVSRELI